MPDTIVFENKASSKCAVFKIDFNGRFVYIDEVTEKLLGLSSVELFGKSIYEFISNSSRQILDSVILNHNRYESFFQAIALSLKLPDSDFHQFDVVLTLNYIGGNPVNYQLILLPAQPVKESVQELNERQFLNLLNTSIDETNLNDVAKIFCQAGGYSEAECYLPDNQEELVTCGSYPVREIGIHAPAYIELFALEPSSRYSFNDGDRILHEGFGHNRSESIHFLNYKNHEKIIVRLSGHRQYQPSAYSIEQLRLYTSIWNNYYKMGEGFESAAEYFSKIGLMVDNMHINLLVTDNQFNIIYCNTSFERWVSKLGQSDPMQNLEYSYKSLNLTNGLDLPIDFSESPFHRAVNRKELSTGMAKFMSENEFCAIVSNQIEFEGRSLYLHLIIPLPENVRDYAQDKLIVESLANDFKAPLLSISALGEQLLIKHKEQINDDCKFLVNCLCQNVSDLQKMIKAVDELSKNWIDREIIKEVSVGDIISEQLKSLGKKYNTAEFVIDIAGDFPICRAPKIKLGVLFGKLLDNAFKFSEKTDKPEISIDYVLEDDWHRFTVYNNGMSIPKKYFSKVFELFFKNPHNLDLPGVGMGLSIARSIVQSWGGSIEVGVESGSRTKASFTLPVYKEGVDYGKTNETCISRRKQI